MRGLGLCERIRKYELTRRKLKEENFGKNKICNKKEVKKYGKKDM